MGKDREPGASAAPGAGEGWVAFVPQGPEGRGGVFTHSGP